jgi:amino acid transporter
MADADKVAAYPSSQDEKTMMSSGQDVASDNNNALSDVEKHGATPQSLPVPDLKRKLKSRHLQMIAIGGPSSPSSSPFVKTMFSNLII